MVSIKDINSEAIKKNIAESAIKAPFSYGKTRVSGKQTFTYNMHSRSSGMPGNKSIYVNNLDTSSVDMEERLRHDFRGNSLKKYIPNQNIKFQNITSENFTNKKFHPTDDETFMLVVRQSYRQILGNYNLMESEKPIEAERHLRNGDLTIRGFIRAIANSPIFKCLYFESTNQLNFIEISTKNLLGRPIKNQLELIDSTKHLYQYGFKSYIDKILNSEEYRCAFGEDTVPFIRSWASPSGLRTSSFTKTIELLGPYSSSDITKKK
tara:strand:- start:74 stop:868 length:795 start_codon:yes stop_codon:yes gene_type:complete